VLLLPFVQRLIAFTGDGSCLARRQFMRR
jgi:hypothetical protein